MHLFYLKNCPIIWAYSRYTPYSHNKSKYLPPKSRTPCKKYFHYLTLKEASQNGLLNRIVYRMDWNRLSNGMVCGMEWFLEWNGMEWNGIVYRMEWFMEWNGLWYGMVYRMESFIERNRLWNGMVYGMESFMEWNGLWNGRVYGMEGFVEWNGLWNGRVYFVVMLGDKYVLGWDEICTHKPGHLTQEDNMIPHCFDPPNSCALSLDKSYFKDSRKTPENKDKKRKLGNCYI